MSDAEQNLEQKEVEQTVEDQQEIDYKAKAEELEQKLNSLAAHQAKLLDEAKQAKQEKRSAYEKELELRRQQEEQAAKNGEFEKLFKQRDKEYKDVLEQMNSLKNNYKKEKLDVQAMQIANDLADGANAKLLSKFISESLTHLADENGSLSDDVLQSVKSDFKSNELYSALMRKSKAEGGGAPGNMRGAQKAGELTKSDFDRLSAEQQHDFLINRGGKVINE